MPREMKILGSKTNKIFLGTKSEFTKLQLKHGVVGSDSGDIGKAIEKIEKLPDAISALPDYVAPLGHLHAAIKSFRSKYDKKHPKFIKAVEDDFLAGPKKIAEKALDQYKGFSNLENQFKSAAEMLDATLKTLRVRSLDAAIVKEAVNTLGAAASLFNNAILQSKSVLRHFNIAEIDTMIGKVEPMKPHFEAIAKKLREVPEATLPAYDTTAAVGILTKLKATCLNMVGAMNKAHK